MIPQEVLVNRRVPQQALWASVPMNLFVFFTTSESQYRNKPSRTIGSWKTIQEERLISDVGGNTDTLPSFLVRKRMALCLCWAREPTLTARLKYLGLLNTKIKLHEKEVIQKTYQLRNVWQSKFVRRQG